jgi:hypothetical protein
MATVTITETDSPSRSKMAGPCWIKIGETYASTKPREIEAAPGATITAEGKVTLRRATRNTTDRQAWVLTVTGDQDDKVTLRLGSPQAVQAVVTGVTGS